jgi:cytochrome c553
MRLLLATLALIIIGVWAEVASPPSLARTQPIAFPHDLHAALNRMDCMYCHYSADRSQDAGMPPLKMCADCHIPNGVPTVRADKPEVQKLIAYWKAQKAIPWVRIYDIPDHVHFPHMRHVAMGSSGVYCQECHGPVQARRDLGLNQPLTMSWCITCHEQRGARSDCVACHY